jgi:hypothetical protein
MLLAAVAVAAVIPLPPYAAVGNIDAFVGTTTFGFATGTACTASEAKAAPVAAPVAPVAAFASAAKYERMDRCCPTKYLSMPSFFGLRN